MKHTINSLILLSLCLVAQATPTTVTAYCPCTKCCGPTARGITASGLRPVPGITCAASRRVPFGTWLHIPGIGNRRVDDRLSKRYDDRVDIYFASHKEALRFGKKHINIK